MIDRIENDDSSWEGEALTGLANDGQLAAASTQVSAANGYVARKNHAE